MKNQKVIVRQDEVFNELDFGHAEEKLSDKLNVNVSYEEASAPEVEQAAASATEKVSCQVWSR